MPDLKAAEGKYDVITLCELLNYLPAEDQRASLRRVRDLLQPGGHCLVSVNIGPAPYFSRESIRALIDECFTIEAADCMCIGGYYQAVETPIFHILEILQRQFWAGKESFRTWKGRIAKLAIGNAVALATYDRVIDFILRKVLRFMPIPLIDWWGKRFSFEKNLSIEMFLLRPKACAQKGK